MQVSPAVVTQTIKSYPRVFKFMPYVKCALHKLAHIETRYSQELQALAVLGVQLSGGGLLYGLYKRSFECMLTSGALGGIFLRCHQQARLVNNLEKILSSIKKNNATLKKQLEDLKEETDKKIASLRVCIATFNYSNKSLRTNVTCLQGTILDLKEQLTHLEKEAEMLKDLIDTTETTVENLKELKKEEQQALQKLEAINRKLEIVTELLSEEKKQLSSEVTRLSSEINRLSDVKA
jgi:hypothetical protein